MITVTIQVKPYLAAYLQSAYAHCTIEGSIRFTKNQNLYSCLLQLTTPRPKGVSWRDQGNITFSLPCPSVGKYHLFPTLPQCRERSTNLQLFRRRSRENPGTGNQL